MVRLKDLREDNDYTQSYIASLLGVRQNTYSQYECEKREIPISMLRKLSELYGTSVDYIIGLTSNPKKYED